ncbi:hypothetical protein C5L14_26855 [Labrys okinawensis]|uniref:Aldolase n=1 Tax=Labrys okinawensis TaxID=346911 RepID=A0A2S9Q539_9HYPH|nr:hypothetical protein [Labrys okinawensis]PRH84472.1 hypothetical protein C5L14_26855 [Labrys okinawensis]
MAYPQTRLDQKLRNIRAGNYKRSDFIIADAKDGDMGSGLAATGFARSADGGQGRVRTRSEFIDQIQAIVEQDIVDIMLVSASNLELLHERGVFRNSAVKPAIRANDTTDCWGGVRHQAYTKHPSRHFRTANLSRAMYGTNEPAIGAPVIGTDLGLYSVTFLNDIDHDYEALDAFAAFREEAADNNFKYFFEVFNPNVDCGLDREQIGEYINDSILRCLAGVTKADRPQFLKIVYNGPKALEELASFDPSLVVGVLGGGAGTTRDTFELLHQAEKYGGRVALFGRKINLAEDPLALLALMRQVADGSIAPDEAVKAYHGELSKSGLKPKRSLEDDLAIAEDVLKPAALKKVA